MATSHSTQDQHGTQTPPPDPGSYPTFQQRLRRIKEKKGLPIPPWIANPTRSSKKVEIISRSLHPLALLTLASGVKKLHGTPGRMVTLHSDGTARKTGTDICLEEAEALWFAKSIGIPAPHVHTVGSTPDGRRHISMEYIAGDTLSQVWMSFSEGQKRDVARQLQGILGVMRSVKPPETYIGAYAAGQIRDSRVHDTYTAPSCRDEIEFNDYLIASLVPSTPPALRGAFLRRLGTCHRVVFTHGDLAPRNIIVRDGKIVGLLDWEDAGWYPECWEYVKFFQRTGTDVRDWWRYADDIFPEAYADELVDYVALSKWQWP